jgi:hypothetical protein
MAARPRGRAVTGKCGRRRTSGRTFSSKNVRYDIPGEGMKKVVGEVQCR